MNSFLTSSAAGVLCVVASTLSAPANEASMKQLALGMNALAANANDDALAHFERAIAADPQNADGLLGRAVYYRKIGSLPQARSDINAALALQPQRATVWQTSGEISLQARDYPGAIRNSSKAISIDDRATVAYYTRGIAYREMNSFDEAMNDLTIAVNRAPDLPRPLLERSKLFDRIGKPAEALADLEKAAAIAPAGSAAANDVAAFRAVLTKRSSQDVAAAQAVAAAEAAAVEAAAACENREQERRVAAAEAAAVVLRDRALFRQRIETAVLARGGEIDALGLPPEVLDAKIVLRGLVIGMPPKPWITLRQWLGLVIETGEYRVVDTRKNEDDTVWAIVLKKPAEPTLTLAFRYDYGDLFSYAIASGDDEQSADTLGGLTIFDRLITGLVGFTFEHL